MPSESLTHFVDYCQTYIRGDEKGEAQIFLDHFFTALGYSEGLKGAGADCEFRIKDGKKGNTSFADLVWKPIVLIEMKKRGEKLDLHYQQAFTYWTQLVPNRPQYVILCNFDEFWIYDLNRQIYDPLEIVPLSKLPDMKDAFAFMLPKPATPLFGKNKDDVTEKVAYLLTDVFKTLSKRYNQEDALRYCLQLILTLFAEDVNLLPSNIFTRILQELQNEIKDDFNPVEKSYDLISGLFREMNISGVTASGRYKGVEYFNGGLFENIYSIELTPNEIELVSAAASKNWHKVNPAIFGSIFEKALNDTERHKLGAHYTHELDIKKIVDPVIVQPWTRKIDQAQSLDDYYILLNELVDFKILDAACGSGNFLFVAFKEMKLIERKLLFLVRKHSVNKGDDQRLADFLREYPYVNTRQFYGIDITPLAVELAKVTLMIAKELSWAENREDYDQKFKPLPLDNLDQNIICEDALLNANGSPREWQQADVIIGNPPYQSKNKMQQEFGVEYINRLRAAYPEVPGRADFCVYWFYKAHQHLKPGCYAGLVGTNTIRQNYSREGSLDYIVNNGGTIFNAVSSEKWSGEAAVFVSIINWKKGEYEGEKILYFLDEKDTLQSLRQSCINSSLSLKTDVSSARVLQCNRTPKRVLQGQTHGHEGFLLSKAKGLQLLKQHPEYAEILKPFLIGDELVSNPGSQPGRFVIDFTYKNQIEASKYHKLYQIIEEKVLPDVEKKAKDEEAGITKPNGRVAQLGIWWKMWRRREDMLQSVSGLKRYIACARVTQRPIFEFISSKINPNEKVMCFAFQDDYTFGIIQSNIHWLWFIEKCTTLAMTPNYNSASIWDTFPFPQHPTEKQVEKVAEAARNLYQERSRTLKDYNMSLRDLYRLLEKPGKNPIKDLHRMLDEAVTEAYGFNPQQDILEQLLTLNMEVATRETNGNQVQSPGLPEWITDKGKFVDEQCVRFEG